MARFFETKSFPQSNQSTLDQTTLARCPEGLPPNYVQEMEHVQNIEGGKT